MMPDRFAFVRTLSKQVFLLLGLVGACGGRVVSIDDAGRGSDGDVTGTMDHGASDTGSGDEDGGTRTAEAGRGTDARACVDIVLSSYDRSCNTKSDCIGITAGTIC